MTPAAAVTRVSREEQARGVSLEQQAADIRRYAEFRGLSLVATLEDAGVSGSIPLAARPAGSRLPELIRTGQVKAVIAYKLDRLFRDVMDCLSTVREWERAGVALHLLDMGGQAVDTSSSVGKFFLTMVAAIAELERKRISERFRDACAHLRAHGVAMGPPPYGWRYTAPIGVDPAGRPLQQRDARGHVMREPHPEEQAALEQMRELRDHGATWSEIAHVGEARGWPLRSAPRWSADGVRRIVLKAEKIASRLTTKGM